MLRVGLVARSWHNPRSVGLRYQMWKGTQNLKAGGIGKDHHDRLTMQKFAGNEFVFLRRPYEGHICPMGDQLMGMLFGGRNSQNLHMDLQIGLAKCK
jgi:hypothetical protein